MKKLTDIKKDFAGWYQDVIFESELVDSAPTRGCFVIRPYGYSIWENIKKILDKKIKELGADNAYFPLLIPESFLKKEAEHVEGFAPEVAVVTHAGGKKLNEPLVVRPTSETIIYYMFAKWIKSWRDLPLNINQWANIVRWEMRPRAFLRTTEFLWQEGHTAHATKGEAIEMAIAARDMYKDFMENFLAIPVIAGKKTDSEKFAGAEETYCLEAIMPDGKGLQMGTTHLLSHEFPKSFDIEFQDKEGKMQTPYCSSWGVSTRMMGGLIMSHGDEKGLVIPPNIAPVQVVIIPIFKNENEKSGVMAVVKTIEEKLNNIAIRVETDNDFSSSPGSRFYKSELKGIPLRIEIGPKDIEKNQVVLANRIEADKSKKKKFVALDLLEAEVKKLLEQIQKELLERGRKRLKNQIQEGGKLEDFKKSLEENNSVHKVGWCGSRECEEMLKPHKGTIRCMLDSKKHTSCFACDKNSISDVIVAKSY